MCQRPWVLDCRFVGLCCWMWVGCTSGSFGEPSVVSDTGIAEADGGDVAVGPSVGDAAYGLYTATSTLEVAWWTPVGANGAGSPIRLSPERGQGFGQGQGSVAYPIVTPDGKKVVLAFYPQGGGCVLYSVSTDGGTQDSAIRLADAPDLAALDRDITDTMLAYVSGDSLYVTPLDGSGAQNPLRVAMAPDGERIEKPQWVKGLQRLTYRTTPVSGGKSRVFSVAADGSQWQRPVALFAAGETVDWVAASLPDGKIVVRGADDRLFVMPAVGGEAIPITPLGKLATVAGISDDGHRVAVEWRTHSFSDRELVSVSTLGLDLEPPVILTEAPVGTLMSVASDTGDRIAWVVPEDGAKWGAYEASFGDPLTQPRHRIAPVHDEKLFLTDYSATERAVVFSTESGKVYVASVHQGEPTPLRLVHSVPKIVNFSFPWPSFSVDGNHVLFSANTPDGWKAWVVPTKGGTAVGVAPPWYSDLVTPFGVLASVHTTQSRILRKNVDGGKELPITGVHQAPVLFPFMESQKKWVLYANGFPKWGWYAGAVDGATVGAPQLVLPLPNPTSYIPSDERPPVVGEWLIQLHNGVLKAYPISPPSPDDPVVLAADGVTRFVVEPDSHRVIFAAGNQVRAMTTSPIESAEWGKAVVVMAEVESVAGLLVTQDGNRVVALTQGPNGAQVLAAHSDGTDAQAPWVVSEGVMGWPMGAVVSPAGDTVVVIYSVMPTAVPHPDLMLVSTIQPTPNTRRVVPNGFLPWGIKECCDVDFQPTGSHFMTQDGKWGIFVGPDGLYSARMDGRDATSPIWLGKKSAKMGDGLSPDGVHVLNADGTELDVSTVGVSGSQRVIAENLPGPIVEARWHTNSQVVVIRTAQGSGTLVAGGLYRIDLSQGATVQTVVPENGLVTGFVGFVPGIATEAMVFQGAEGGDLSLYRVDMVGGKPVTTPWTEIDDTAESWVGMQSKTP